MSGGGSRHVGAPRTLDVQQFANARGVEVQSLHAVLKEKKAQDGASVAIPRSLRRRTTSHNRRKSFFWKRKAKKRKRGALDEAPGGDEVAVIAKKPPCRRVRRRIELKGDENGGGGCSSDGTQRLVTHVWHAKRFTMSKIWGHWLAEGLPGRGRGSRSVVRWRSEAAVLHDASFYSAIELEGSEESIAEALQLVLEPAPPGPVELMSQKDKAVYSGAEYGKAMLHHMGRSPRGAIAPVTYVWRPESKVGEERRMWLWVHAAAFEEALACLQILCQSQGIHEKEKLQCWSRKGQFGVLDLFGSKAMSVLQKVLHPVARAASEEAGMDAVSTRNVRFLEKNNEFPAGAVVEMEVWDPRCHPDSDTTFEPSVLSDAGSDENGVEVMDLIAQKSKPPSTFNQLDVDIWDTTRQESIVLPLSEKDLSMSRHKKRLSYIQLNDTSEDTAAIGNSKCSIMVLKHDRCGFSLLLPIAWVRAFWVPLVFAGGRAIGLRERHWLHTDAKLPSFPHDYPDCYSYDKLMAEKSAEYQETYDRRPPSKRGIWKSELPDWNFVHEPSWLDSGNCITAQDVSSADFGAEISFGIVAADSVTDPSKTSNPLRSTGSEASSAQLNTCSSAQHVQQMGVSRAGVSGATVTENSVLDQSKPSNDDPTSSSQPVATTDEGRERKSDSPAADLEELGASRVSKGDDSGECSMFVARTRETLEKTLRDCSLHHLPLLQSGDTLVTNGGYTASQLAGDGSVEFLKKGCLVRVLIHAPRKGAFDEGAVIYLPLPSDVNSYFCSSTRWQGFEDESFKQVQQTTLKRRKKRRKKEIAEGEGEIVSTSHNISCQQTDLPDSCSLRVPLGIITSASVRGSASLAAIGICEVAGLGVLKARQMADKRWPSSTYEIFLLVRNKFSSMYRPALASIVDETGDDLE